MRNLAIAMALASTALASPAMARDDAWYIGVEAGAMIVEDIDLDIGAIDNGATIDSKYGYDADGIIGYDFGMFRAEAEVAYKRANIDSLTATAGIPRGNSGTLVNGTFDGAAGSVSALSFMVNGLLDFGGEDDGLAGYVGGGVGVARVKYDGVTVQTPEGGPFLDDSDTGFAWQVIAGIRAPITDHWDVGVKYRFFNVDNVDMVDRLGRDVSSRFRSHSLLGSFIYNFGAPTPPPPPPPEPAPPPPPVEAPPPPPPPVVECTPGPYIVFFEWDKSDITPEAASILDNAVTAYGNCGQAQVMLAGHADRSGSAKYNVGLSERRNASVRAYLESRGIAGGVITTQAFGESRPRVETADGVRELQNRRVEITYGPGAGM
ncbi:outer membrane protein OmpA-like peptidoglycan-associated protein [Sphingomonas zeicaulis]|uniref:OmpA family protein n=1 Tax=Sphingomonas zeicaulis TaxID=1632740 RepID=UPI003D1D7231